MTYKVTMIEKTASATESTVESAPIDPLADATAKLASALAENETLKGQVSTLRSALGTYKDRSNWAPGGKFDLRNPGFDGYYTADVALAEIPPGK